MVDELKALPTLSYDLITYLDENVALPVHYQPGSDFDSHVQVGGMRKLINLLKHYRDLETNPDEVQSDDGVAVLEVGGDGQLPSILGPGRVLGPSLPSIQVDIGPAG